MNDEKLFCGNCDREIGRLEEACLWQDHPVCADCHKRLSDAARYAGATGAERGEPPLGLYPGFAAAAKTAPHMISLVEGPRAVDASARGIMDVVDVIGYISVFVCSAALLSGVALACFGGPAGGGLVALCSGGCLIIISLWWYVTKSFVALLGKIAQRLRGPWRIESGSSAEGE